MGRVARRNLMRDPSKSLNRFFSNELIVKKNYRSICTIHQLAYDPSTNACNATESLEQEARVSFSNRRRDVFRYQPLASRLLVGLEMAGLSIWGVN
jgi:hypothetical protein